MTRGQWRTVHSQTQHRGLVLCHIEGQRIRVAVGSSEDNEAIRLTDAYGGQQRGQPDATPKGRADQVAAHFVANALEGLVLLQVGQPGELTKAQVLGSGPL